MRLALLLTTAIGFFVNSALADDQSNIPSKSKKVTFSCVVKQTYQLDSSGRLIEQKEPPMTFSVNRETGKFSDPSWPFFAAPSSQQNILHPGGQGEPFTLLSTNRSAEGGLNVEFLSVKTYQKNGKFPFVAYGLLGNIYSGVCE